MDPTHNSIPRNRLLAMLFYDVELIENYGSGIQRILEECKRLNFPMPEFKEVEGGFQVIFYKNIYSEENLIKMGLNERQIKAVMHIKEIGKLNNREYQKKFGVAKATATRDLTTLVEKKILYIVGKGKRDIYYLLSEPKMSQKDIE